MNEKNDGYAVMTLELITIVDSFLMGFPIMQAITPIKSYPTGLALEQASSLLFSPTAPWHWVNMAYLSPNLKKKKKKYSGGVKAN